MAEREVLFIGGTGRSGTHVLSHLLECHSRYARVPIEARFHTNPRGLPDLIAGRTDLDSFVKRMRKFWWKRIRAGEVAPVLARRLAFGRKVRGLHLIVPRERFESALDRFEAEFQPDPIRAARNLFHDLLWPIAEEAGKPALIEMSCFTAAEAPTLLEMFPNSKVIHIVRDGRDAGSSKVSKRQKRSHPRNPWEGINWWEGRLRNIEKGISAAPQDRVLAVGLDELVDGDRETEYARVLDFLGIEDEPEMRRYFEEEMSADAAHKERWREGLSPEEQSALEKEYERTLQRLERDDFHCAPILRRAFERASTGGGPS